MLNTMRYCGLAVLLALSISACDKEDRRPHGVGIPGATTELPIEDVLLVCAGQSNMASLYNNTDYPVHPRVTNLESANRSACAEAAARIADAYPLWHVFTANYAMGGSTIAEWAPGMPFYNRLVSQSKLRLQGKKLIGFLWYQGESDARDTFDPDWNNHFLQLLSAYRGDMAVNMPVVFAQIGGVEGQSNFPNWSVFQDNQAALIVPNGSMIRTADIPVIANVHHDYYGDKTVGDRMAQALVLLLRGTI